jgi:hypothetical protein
LQSAYKKLQSAILLEYHLRTRVYPLETCISFEPLLAQTSCRLFHRSSPNGIGGAAIIFPAISFFPAAEALFISIVLQWFFPLRQKPTETHKSEHGLAG